MIKTLTPREEFERLFIIRPGDLVVTNVLGSSRCYQVTELTDYYCKTYFDEVEIWYKNILGVYRLQKNGHFMCLWVR